MSSRRDPVPGAVGLPAATAVVLDLAPVTREVRTVKRTDARRFLPFAACLAPA